jgi:hypothetical protein
MGLNLIDKALRDTELESSTRLCYILLCRYANEDNGKCFPSLEKLSQGCNVGHRMIRRNLKLLEEKGYIQILNSALGQPHQSYLVFPDDFSRRLPCEPHHGKCEPQYQKEPQYHDDGTTLPRNLNYEKQYKPRDPLKEEFNERFWPYLLLKSKRPEAEEAFVTAWKSSGLNGTELAQRFNDHVRYWRDNGREDKYIQRPTNWLISKGWLKSHLKGKTNPVQHEALNLHHVDDGFLDWLNKMNQDYNSMTPDDVSAFHDLYIGDKNQ